MREVKRETDGLSMCVRVCICKYVTQHNNIMEGENLKTLCLGYMCNPQYCAKYVIVLW